MDEARYPNIALNLRHSTFDVAATKLAALSVDIGDRIVVDDPPSGLPPDDISQLILGYREVLTGFVHTVNYNCLPESPYHVTELDSVTLARADTEESTLNEALDTTETEVDVTTVSGPIWTVDPDDFPFDVKVGGEVMTVSAMGVVLNANPSFETSTTGWTAFGSSTLTRVSTFAQEGSFSGLLTSDAGGDPRAEADNAAVTVGLEYRYQGYLYSPVALPTDVAIGINWFTAGIAYISTSQTNMTLVAGEWNLINATATAPGTAAFGQLRFSFFGTPGAGEELYGDGLRLIRVNTQNASPQTFTVTRSVNGVVKSHSSGADIRLAQPAIVAL